MHTTLSRIRAARSLRAIDIASMAQVSVQTVRNVERGRVLSTPMRCILQIAAALNVTAVEIVPALGVKLGPTLRGAIGDAK